MKLPTHQLKAFWVAARLRNFTNAAKEIGVTQSALSQRIASLEDYLETTLIIRDRGGLRLTEAGEKLLRYCQVQESIEAEALGQIVKKGNTLSGVVRVAGFSSVLRSVAIPALAPFLRANPGVQCEFRSYEVIELFRRLRNAEADFILLDYHLDRSEVKEHTLGQEEYVVIESSKYKTLANIYLDHGPEDNATDAFFRHQGKAGKVRRSFMGDVYGILEGVEQGLGRAVMSKHLIEPKHQVRQLTGYKKYTRDITLNYFDQPYYSSLHQRVVKELCENARLFL